ncbi:NEDD4-binding protein 1 [Echeneis naucrates]|uniref:NEDD4-binding protein 1-like n=1 Tax=Echeneis naucrates TaxID=173247 RepID=A0A665V6W4_ECHNA|nr:NEDD4-binding protein 1-like [Echeneis naucrates]
MDGERSDGGGGGDPEVEDEFACAGMLRSALTTVRGTVERIFRVAFGIGTDDSDHGNNRQIWLKLRGQRNDVKAAKLFVKGVVNQEVQQELCYPVLLHCVFSGARGLFMDCLIKSTSAHIAVGSPGFLLISGLAEPVVRAYSLITDLVDRYEGTQSRRPETGDRGPDESLDSRRAFKTLVEKWDDRHTLDLLVLPGAVKEILLDLVKESGLGSAPTLAVTNRKETEDKPSDTLTEPFNTIDRLVEGMTAGSGQHEAAKDPFQGLSTSAGTRGRAEGAEVRLMHAPQEVGEEGQLDQREALDTKEEEEKELQSSRGNKEFWLLLKFFTAMGYTDDVVKRVLARTGLKEASQILDLVQQEQDCSDREQALQGGPDVKAKDGGALNRQESNRPCETEHRVDEQAAEGGDKAISSNGEVGEVADGEGLVAAGHTKHLKEGNAEETEEGHEDDFVLGVLKKAAASCGYTEHKVAEVYNMLPDRSTHQLLVELQREDSKVADLREGPREMDDVVLEKDGPEDKQKEESDGESWVELPQLIDLVPWIDKTQQPPMSQYAPQPKQHQPSKSQTLHQILPEVKGPPMSTYPTSQEAPLPIFPNNKQHGQTVYPPHTSTPKQAPHPQHAVLPRNDLSPKRGKDRRAFVPSLVVVTGEQRFLEGLQTPFDLKLTDQPGDPKLRAIIIDGSNVAMSHGLGHFFSCRGIALAVQHFWDRGHRHICALLPQWRQKIDPKTKEQHYLTELQKLGLLSYTPSREVQGKRISSYDDRFMLQHAQKTNGVIVTNDNLRDLLDESTVWRDIIKKRLLQYTFVGDHFMVPDDPLGRGGPHLDDFLRSEHRTPDPGNHSFAGVATPFLPSASARSQTEVLNFRDRTPGGGLDSGSRGGRVRGRGFGKGWDQHRQHGAAGPGLVPSTERDPEETAHLRQQLSQVFPGQDNMVTLVLQCHPAEMDINVLSGLILEQQQD